MLAKQNVFSAQALTSIEELSSQALIYQKPGLVSAIIGEDGFIWWILSSSHEVHHFHIVLEAARQETWLIILLEVGQGIFP